MVDDRRKRHVVGIYVDAPAHAIKQAIRLLENLLEHEIRIASLFQLAKIDVHRFHRRVHARVVHIHHLQLVSGTDDGDVPVFQVHHLVSVFHNRSGIRGQIKLIVAPDAHHQRTALACGDDLFGMPFVQYRDGIGTDDLMQGHLHGTQQIQIIAHLDIFNELHQHFGIRLAAELHAALLQTFLQRGIVLDDAVMDQRQVARCRIMGMGVFCTWFAMRGPTRMGDTDMPAHVFCFHRAFQIADLAFRLIHIQISRITDQSHAGTVITTVLQTLKSFYQNGVSLSLTYISDYSTHIPFIFPKANLVKSKRLNMIYRTNVRYFKQF